MYQKIMVPLDGSELAECVLPHVATIARGCNVAPRIDFVRVVEPPAAPYGTLTDGGSVYTAEQFERDRQNIEKFQEQEADAYLKKIASENKFENAIVNTVVLTGHAGETLAEYAEKNGIDLIVIASHGRSGIKRWIWGSTTDKILRSACVPVFTIRAPGCVAGV
jgi:nucleotide-binding universal stress UspA family protein